MSDHRDSIILSLIGALLIKRNYSFSIICDQHQAEILVVDNPILDLNPETTKPIGRIIVRGFQVEMEFDNEPRYKQLAEQINHFTIKALKQSGFNIKEQLITKECSHQPETTLH